MHGFENKTLALVSRRCGEGVRWSWSTHCFDPELSAQWGLAIRQALTLINRHTYLPQKMEGQLWWQQLNKKGPRSNSRVSNIFRIGLSTGWNLKKIIQSNLAYKHFFQGQILLNWKGLKISFQYNSVYTLQRAYIHFTIVWWMDSIVPRP